MSVNRAIRISTWWETNGQIVQQIVDFAHAFPRFSVVNNKTGPCIPEFLPTIFRVLEGLAGYPIVMKTSETKVSDNQKLHTFYT